jgi:hypothetical protein
LATRQTIASILPKATLIAVLINPNYADAENQLREVLEAAADLRS